MTDISPTAPAVRPRRLQRVLRGMLVSTLMALGLAGTAQGQGTPLLPSAAALLDWAEHAHPQLFPDAARNQVHQDFLYRHHPSTGNFVGIAADGAWLLGPVAGNATAPVHVGSRSDFACLVYPANCSSASDFPSRPLTLVVPFAAGGPTDRLARDLATVLAQRLGRPVTVQDLPGRDGLTGAAQVAGAAADGYTLLLHNTSLAITPTAYRGSSPDADSLAPIGLVADMPMVLVARKTLPASDWATLRAWIAGQAGQARIAHSGYSGTPYACLALLHPLLGAPYTERRVSGTAPALADLLSGAADLMCLDAGFAAPYIASGQLKAIVQTGLIRSSQAALAGVPTLHDSGHPGFSLTSWAALLAPKGTPAVVMERLDAAVRAVTEDPAFRQRQQAFSQEPIDDARAGAVGAARFMQAETGRLGEALRALGRYVE